MRKRMITILIVMVMIHGIVELSFSTEIKGTVLRIEGKNIILKNAEGKETTIEVKEVPAALKVGDSITIKDGAVVPSGEEKPLEGC